MTLLMSPTPAWGDREIGRFMYRTGLFKRRGLTTDEAERFADRLALRDYERDERRACIECQSIQRGGRCFAASQGRMPGVSKFLEVLPTQLQRCSNFTFQTP